VNDDRPCAATPGELPDEVYRVLIEQARVGVFVTQENRLLYVNTNLTELFGYSRAEMLSGMDPLLMTAPVCVNRFGTVRPAGPPRPTTFNVFARTAACSTRACSARWCSCWAARPMS